MASKYYLFFAFFIFLIPNVSGQESTPSANQTNLNDSIQILKNDYKKLKENSNGLQLAIASLKHNLEETNKDLISYQKYEKDLLDSINQLIKKSQEKKSEYDRVVNELAFKQEKLSAIEVEHSNTKIELLNTKKKAKAANVKVTETEAELNNALAVVKEERKKFIEENTQNKKNKEEIGNLQSSILKLETSISKFIQDSVIKKRELENLKTQNSNLDKEFLNAKTENITKQKELDKLKQSNLTFKNFLIYAVLFAVIGIFFVSYFVIIKKQVFSKEEQKRIDETESPFLKDQLKQFSYYKRASIITRYALFIGLSITTLMVLGLVILTVARGSVELLSGEKFIKLLGAYAVPLVFTSTIYNVIESKRTELSKLLQEKL